jgi:MerR family transcriptional regulator, copper efflux regulator
MTSGELARAAGVSADTLRHYEKKGLLPAPPRRDNRYRVYPPAAVQRVRVIQRALDMGFTLDDLARVLRQRDAGGAPCGQVRAIAAKRLQELESRVAALIDLRDELRQLVQDWDDRLATLLPGQRAGLLDALAATEAQDHRAKVKRTKVRLNV